MLAFGNPNRELLKYIKVDNYLCSLLPQLVAIAHPDNNSQDVIDEINHLIKWTNAIAEDEVLVKKVTLYDREYDSYIANVLANKGISKADVQNLSMQIKEDISPIVVKLKYGYQRLRPVQLSYLLNMRLYPFQSVNSDCPSYPSMYAVHSRTLCHVLANNYPEYHNQLEELGKDIAQSRISMGVNYLSDIKFSNAISDLIIKHPEFIKKYNI